MIDRRRLGRHGLGLALFFGWLFVALSVVGFDPLDSPARTLWTADEATVQNPCGPVGAWLAWGHFQSVGWASVVVLWGLGVGVLIVERRKSVADWGLRIGGFAGIVLVAAAVLAAADDWRGVPLVVRGPLVGSGGYAGAILATFLSEQFGPLGMGLILVGVGLASGAVCQDLLVQWPLRELSLLMARRRPRAAPYAGVSGEPYPAVADRPMPRPLPAPAEPEGWPSRVASMVRPQPALPAAKRREPATYVHPAPADGKYAHPPFELLERGKTDTLQDDEELIQQRAIVLEKTLREHGCVVRVVQIDTGPVITQFEIELEAGLRVSKVLGLSNDLAIALAVPSVRIVASDSGEDDGRHRGSQRPPRHGAAGRGDRGGRTEDDAGKMRVPLFLGRDVKGTLAGVRPGGHAAPADRRAHGHG